MINRADMIERAGIIVEWVLLSSSGDNMAAMCEFGEEIEPSCFHMSISIEPGLHQVRSLITRTNDRTWMGIHSPLFLISILAPIPAKYPSPLVAFIS